MTDPREILAELVKISDTDLKSVSEKIGKNHAYLQQYLTRGTPRVLGVETREKLGEILGVDPDVFREQTDPEHVTLHRMPKSPSVVFGQRRRDRATCRIAEYDSYPFSLQTNRQGRGKAPILDRAIREPSAFWEFPREFLKEELLGNQYTSMEQDGDSEGQRIIMLRVPGQDMAPDYQVGERIVVDIAHITPSPSGVFLLSDGMNVVLRWVEIVFGADPVQIRIMSRNMAYSTYECPLSEVRILGRVLGKWSRA